MAIIYDHEWTPKRVSEELIEAVGWATRTGGRVGPAGFGSGMPEIMMTQMERIAEQWPLLPNDPPRRAFSPARVSQMERILLWQTKYLSESPIVAVELSIWLFCKVRKGARYGAILERAGKSRATSNRSKDRALALISVGLTKDRIKRGQH